MSSSVPKNPPPLTPGMDNPWYDYSPFPLRPKLTWPRNARVASFVLLHLEYWELMPDESSHRDPRLAGEFGSYVPDYRDLDAARVRQPDRHLPRPRRARPLPDPGRRCGECAGGRALSVSDRAVQEAQIRVHRARPFGQPHDHLEDERGRGEGRDRRSHRCRREGGGRAAQGLAGPGLRREPAHTPASCRCRPRLRDRLAERRPALPDEGRQEVRLDAQPAGMGRRPAALAAPHQHARAIPTWWARPSSGCTTRAARCSTSRSIPG